MIASLLWLSTACSLPLFHKLEQLKELVAPASHRKGVASSERPEKKYVPAFTFSQWEAALKKYPEFPSTYVSETPLPYQELVDALQDAARAYKKVHRRFSWYKDHPLPDSVYTLESSEFIPYIQRATLKTGARVFFWGDIHGSTHSVVRGLKKLKQQGFLFDNFRLKDGVSLFFLGDMVDRGKYSAEVVYTVARLKAANPTAVFVLRGNHERMKEKFKGVEKKKPGSRQDYEFLTELKHKYSAHKDQFAIPFNFLNCLPLAVYVTAGTCLPRQYVQCNHAGVDLGVNLHDFLASDDDAMVITCMLRKENLAKLPASCARRIRTHLEKVAPVEISNFCFTGLEAPVRNGFMWHDFDFKENQFFNFELPSRWWYGKELTAAILALARSLKAELCGLIKGHQHDFTVYEDLWRNRGIFVAWDGLVVTLFSGPANFLPDAEKELLFYYDSFILAQTAPRYADWRFTHYWRSLKKSSSGAWHEEPFVVVKKSGHPIPTGAKHAKSVCAA